MGDIYPLTDQITDQLSSMVNMLQIGRRPKASLQTILEENPDSESQPPMEVITETATIRSPFPPFRGGGIFNVSVDSPPQDGETDEDRASRINRNANRVQRRANEATIVLAEAARNGEKLDSQGRPRPLRQNLDDEFVHVDSHDVYKSPSANLAVATNELAYLEQTLEVAKVTTMLKAAHYQVNKIRQDQRPSYSMSSIRRSTMPRSNRRPSQSRFADQHRDDGQPSRGELGETVSNTLANMTRR